jgi:hypothetical protein
VPARVLAFATDAYCQRKIVEIAASSLGAGQPRARQGPAVGRHHRRRGTRARRGLSDRICGFGPSAAPRRRTWCHRAGGRGKRRRRWAGQSCALGIDRCDGLGRDRRRRHDAWRDCSHEGKRALRFDPQRSPHTAAMAAKLHTVEGKAAYRRRKWIAEPPNGWIKNVLGLRQFSLRGLHRVPRRSGNSCAWR